LAIENDETRWLKLKLFSRDLAERLGHKASATGLRARVARLESRIKGEKQRIGEALYPLVERAEITVELPAVQEGVEEIARLREEIRQIRKKIEVLERDPGPPQLPAGEPR
jgi:ubiquinone biosynthesis protein UbiJ